MLTHSKHKTNDNNNLFNEPASVAAEFADPSLILIIMKMYITKWKVFSMNIEYNTGPPHSQSSYVH